MAISNRSRGCAGCCRKMGVGGRTTEGGRRKTRYAIRDTRDARRGRGEAGRCHQICETNPISWSREVVLSDFGGDSYVRAARGAGRKDEANLAAGRAAISDLKSRIADGGAGGRRWEGRTAEDRRQRTEDGVRQTKPICGVLGPETAVGRENKANWGQAGDRRGRMTEGRQQRADDRRQRTECRGQRAEGRGDEL